MRIAVSSRPIWANYGSLLENDKHNVKFSFIIFYDRLAVTNLDVVSFCYFKAE